uniref:Uncharacterized protein n=1 Tax=Tanacetum cinerariifolium TaxID=118510 RepID=A0A6L2MR11_TANCI|nr:hypothetical protein [Tanacetum cinerariifolium]
MIIQIKSRIQAARDRQKSYADKKLNPRYIRTFKILAKVRTIAYQLEFPDQLSRVHSTFYVLNLKKCLSEETLAISLDEIQIDEKLHFIKESVKIIDREIKRLKQSRILIVKVCWNSRRGPVFTWEREDQMQKKYPHLFANSTPAADVTSCWSTVIRFRVIFLLAFSLLHFTNQAHLAYFLSLENGGVSLHCFFDVHSHPPPVHYSSLLVLNMPQARKGHALVDHRDNEGCGLDRFRSGIFFVEVSLFMSGKDKQTVEKHLIAKLFVMSLKILKNFKQFMMMEMLMSSNSVSCDVVVESSVPSRIVLNAFTEEIVAYKKESDETHVVKKLDALCTPELFVTHSNFDTPGGTVYYIPKYAAEARFVVRCSCQKRLRNGDVKQKSSYYKFVLNVFDTIHNHELEREEFKSKKERQLTYLEQAFIVKAASVNIGATRAHHLLTGLKMLIHKMENRKKHVFDFSFDYFVESVELSAIFWADEVSKYNCREFGNVVSFDTTFKTNKYNMVFVPFTAIDNHKKCVTVVAGLLRNESTKSYIWLLKAFIKAFGKAPSIVVTYQDRAMRNAIEAEFTGSKHQLCMWHITLKLPAKVRECELFFSHFTNSGSTLMNFINCFETAMEKQRHVQERMDHKTIDIVPKLKTFLKIVLHASNVYTRSLFELVQKEIFVGFGHCQIDSKSLVEGSEVCIIKESPHVYEMPKKKKKSQSVDKCMDKADEDDPVDMFFKKMDFIRNKRNRYGEKNVVVKNFANEATSINKTDNLEQLVGVPKPPVVEVNNPTVGSTKGQKKLRIKGGKKKATKKSLKGMNSCSLCSGTDHNKRPCPGRFEVEDEVVLQKKCVKRKLWFKKKCVKRKLFKKK